MALAQQVKLKTIAWAGVVLWRPLTRWLARRTFANCTGVVCAIAALLRCYPIGKFPVPAPDPVWALDATSVPGLWDLRLPEWLCVASSVDCNSPRQFHPRSD